MRFAAISDVHGNRAALDAVLDDIAGQQITDIVNLGDHCSGPLEARRAAERLMQLDGPAIRGNHDRTLIEAAPEAMGASDAAAYAELAAGHLAWLASLPATLVYRDEVFLCHGTPASDHHYWLETVSADGRLHLAAYAAIERCAAGLEFGLMLCGHSHVPRAVRLRDGRLVVNPGSVGCPGYEDETPSAHVVETGLPDASYAILERRQGRWQATFRHVAYDHGAMAALALERGRPEWARVLDCGWLRG